MDLLHSALLVVAGIAGGVMAAIVGGAAVITFPALLAAGRKTLEQRWRLVGLVLVWGLLLNYLLVVAVGSLWAAMIAALVIAFCSLVLISIRCGRAAADYRRNMAIKRRAPLGYK